MSIADTLIDISNESLLNQAEKGSLRLIAKEVKAQAKQIKELEDSDAWMKKATEYYENGGCPICFSTDEAGCTEGCYLGQLQRKNEELEDKIERHRWIPVSERLPEEGICLVLCERKVYEVKVRISEDEWEDNKGKSFLKETAHCAIEHLGGILIGHDECITHWKPIIKP